MSDLSNNSPSNPLGNPPSNQLNSHLDNHLGNLQSELKSWATSAQNQGWLTENDIQAIDGKTTATPGTLFDIPNRPLVVGFFGGTGVGKSTLMNRFAGEPIAKASAERPTSREITIYVHESVSIAQLPKEFPMHRMHTKTHANSQYQSVMWIDMPDFDSVEQANRELVEHWLPHIDVVIYVVSPDRYKDDDGWRLLLEHGTQHAWLFVINHWDRGDERQRDDFLQMLNAAGLANPHLFCTDSGDALNKPKDEFVAFQETVVALADQQLIEQLESRGVVQRFEQFRHVSDNLRTNLGSPEQLQQLDTQWDSHWPKTVGELQDSVAWKIPTLAKLYAGQEKGLLASLLARIKGQPIDATHNMVEASQGIDTILDGAFFDRVDESVNDFAQQATHSGVSINAIQKPLVALQPQWQQNAHSTVESAIVRSIETPGTAFGRLLHRILGGLCWLLPLAAMGWVGFRIINVFRLSANDPGSYLSGSFAVHSVLLVLLAWLIPTVLFIKFKPSREKAAARGARTGINNLSAQLNDQVQGSLKQLAEHQQLQLVELDNIMATSLQIDDAQMPQALQRMLISDESNLASAT